MASSVRECALTDENACLKRPLAEQTQELTMIPKDVTYFIKHLK